QINIRGYESFPGKLIPPTYEITMGKSLINCLIGYYEQVYADLRYKFYSGIQKQDKDTIFVSSSMICISALYIADEWFGSQLCRSDFDANVIVAFLNNEDNLEYWPATICYFFKHTIALPNRLTEHILAIVDWYSKYSKKDHFNILRRGLSKILDRVVQNGIRHVELWKPLIRRKLTHENIIPIQRILLTSAESSNKRRFQKNLQIVEQNNNYSCKSFLPYGSNSSGETLGLVLDFDCDDYDDNYEEEPFKYNENLFELLVNTDSDNDFSSTTSYSEYSERNDKLNKEENDISNDQFEKEKSAEIPNQLNSKIHPSKR
ncbi:12782_t:CDS:2, partial [Funneliformis caledonium]